jgi:hypothetical protein
MGDFIENGTLAGPMADAKPLPAGANPNLIPNLTAARWNEIRQALIDTRGALLNGALAGITAENMYPDTATGLAAVAEGAYFTVPSFTETESLILYRKVSAAAVEMSRYPSALIVAAAETARAAAESARDGAVAAEAAAEGARDTTLAALPGVESRVTAQEVHTSGWVNVRSYGAKGDGVTDDYADLAAMVTALGSTAATLIVPGPCLVGTNLTIPANLPVRFEGAGAFTGAGRVTYLPAGRESAAPVPITFRPLYDINPILNGSRTPYANNALKDPAVYVASNAIHLFYSYGRDDGVTGGWNIGHAKSTSENAFDFTHHGIAIAQGADGSYDELGLFAPSPPVLVGGTYYMWYVAVADRAGTGNKNIAATPQAPWSVALATATSLDGPWTKQGVVLNGLTEGHTLDPWVIPASESPDGMYRMYVSQMNGGYRKVALYRAASPEGPWTKYGVVFDPRSGPEAWTVGSADVENPAVIKIGARWFLTVDEAAQVRSHVAVSADGLAFTVGNASTLAGWNYIGTSNLQTWDQAGSDSLSPFWLNGQLFAVYQGSRGDETWALGVAELGRAQQRWPTTSKAGSAAFAPTYGSLTLKKLADPAAPTVVATGSGATTYTYVVVGYLPDGTRTAASAATSVTNAAALDATNYNAITLPVVSMEPRPLYDVWRTAGGTTGKITQGVAPAYDTALTIIDNGLVGDGTTPPAFNNTGMITADNGGTFKEPVTVQSAGNVYLLTLKNTAQDTQVYRSAPNGKGIYEIFYNGTQMRWFWGKDYATDDFFIERHTGAGGTNQGKAFEIENATGYVKLNGHRIAYGTAAPAAGTWALGDRVFNSAPAVGQPKGWICTVAGTPGAWVSEGNL